MRKTLFILLSAAALPLNAAHPLLTEDTGTQGAGNFQLEVNYDASRDRVGAERTRSGQLSTVLSYGVGETLDLQIGAPYLRRRSDDGMGSAASVSGGGDASIDLKWRFFERDGLSFGLKPGITLSTGDERRGLGQGRTTWGAILIASKEAGDWAFHGHLGARRNSNTIGERRNLYQISAAATWQAMENLKLVIDAGVTRQPDPALGQNPAFLVLGFIYSPAKHLDLDAGWRRALNNAAVDRTIGAGVTLRW